MRGKNRRKAARVPFGVPVQIDSETGPIEAELVDVSRTGARIRVLSSDIGHPPSLDLAETALQVAAALPPHFEARLHYQVLGPLLHRGMNMMRIAVPIDAPSLIELGCCFDRPLNLDEITALGVALPQVESAPPAAPQRLDQLIGEEPVPVAGADDSQARPTLRVLPPEDPEPPLIPRFTSGISARYRAYVSGTLDVSPPTLPCWSDQLNRQAVRVRVPRAGYEAEDVTGATVRFTSQYGSHVQLKLVEGPVHLWTGRARVCGVELPQERAGDMLVTLAFARALRPAETRRLRLQTLPA